MEQVVKVPTQEEVERQERIKNQPPLDRILNLHDFEVSRGVSRSYKNPLTGVS